MKTSLDTKAIAGLIQSFLLGKNLRVARCDALELAAKIKGLRDLHEDRAGVSPVGQTTLTNEEACLFFDLLAHLCGMMGIEKALANSEEILPIGARWICPFIAKRLKSCVHGSWRAVFPELGFPSFVVSLLEVSETDNGQGFNKVSEMLKRSEKLHPVFTLTRRPAGTTPEIDTTLPAPELARQLVLRTGLSDNNAAWAAMAERLFSRLIQLGRYKSGSRFFLAQIVELCNPSTMEHYLSRLSEDIAFRAKMGNDPRHEELRDMETYFRAEYLGIDAKTRDILQDAVKNALAAA